MKEILIKGVATPVNFSLLTMEALNEGARRSGLTTRYTEDEVWDMLDDEPALIPRLYELFAESITPLTDRLGDILPAEQ